MLRKSRRLGDIGDSVINHVIVIKLINFKSDYSNLLIKSSLKYGNQNQIKSNQINWLVIDYFDFFFLYCILL